MEAGELTPNSSVLATASGSASGGRAALRAPQRPSRASFSTGTRFFRPQLGQTRMRLAVVPPVVDIARSSQALGPGLRFKVRASQAGQLGTAIWPCPGETAQLGAARALRGGAAAHPGGLRAVRGFVRSPWRIVRGHFAGDRLPGREDALCMEFGIALATSTESWRAVVRAEQLGFAHAWFYDTQLLNADVFVAMTQAAMHTERIRLGTGVLVPSNRIEPVTANALATLAKIAPGRIDFGVGTGFTARRTMGLGALPLARMKLYVERVQALLRGETIEWDLEGRTRKLRFLNPDFCLINLDDEIPLHVSAMGPKARRMAAELGGGWLNFGGQLDPAVADLNDIRSAWTAAGHAHPLHSTFFTLGCVLRPGEALDSERVLAQAGPWVSVFLHNLVEATEAGTMEGLLPPVAYEALERYREIYRSYEPEDARYLTNHRGHLMFQRPEERPLMSAELIETLMGFVGTPDTLRTRIRALAEAGYSQLAIQLVEHHEDALEEWAQVFEAV